jgi:WD40 repeat protein
VAGGTASGGVYLRRLDQPTVAREIAHSSGSLNDLRFSPDERHLAVADRNLTLIPLAQADSAVRLRTDEANYGTVRFTADGGALLTVNGRGAISYVDLRTGAVQPGHCCTSIWGEVAFSPDEKSVLWAGHWPGVWDLRSGTVTGRFTAERQFLTFGPIAIDPTHGSVYMGSQDGRVFQWNLQSRRLLATSPPRPGYVRTIAVLGKSGWIAYAAADGGPVHLWNPSTGESRTISAALPTSNLVFDEVQSRTLLGTESGQVEFWDLPRGRLLDSTPLLTDSPADSQRRRSDPVARPSDP